MSQIDRREFLLKAFKRKDIGKDVATTDSSELVIGRVIDFPVGEKSSQELHQLTIESFPEGLRAQSMKNHNQFYSIKMNQAGELIVNRMEIWPASKVFSILTNEPAYLDMSSEDKS